MVCSSERSQIEGNYCKTNLDHLKDIISFPVTHESSSNPQCVCSIIAETNRGGNFKSLSHVFDVRNEHCLCSVARAVRSN